MCLIVALLLALGGFFGLTTITSRTITPPQIVEVQPTVEAVQLPTQVIACATQSPAADISDTLKMIDPGIFEPTLWTSRGTFDADRTATTWQSATLGAVAYLEFLHFDCGVSRQQIDDYFSPANFQTILSGYSSYRQTYQCNKNGLRLFQFDADLSGASYHILLWVRQVSPTRVADFVLTFPATQPAKQAEYAARLFPQLPTCEAAAG